ncbi:hypothetical protein EC988_007168, partial [Linderina pennispora]
LDLAGDNLGIPDDLKLEFDQALSNVGSDSPPPAELTVDLSGIKRGALPMPSGSVSASQSWDVRSPDDDNVPKSAQIISKTSSGASSSTQSISGKSLGRRQGIYGITLPNTASTATGPLSPTPIMLRESDILIDIARELSEDSPAAETAVQPESPCYIDDADIAKHMNAMTVADYRPLPPVPRQTQPVSRHQTVQAPKAQTMPGMVRRVETIAAPPA